MYLRGLQIRKRRKPEVGPRGATQGCSEGLLRIKFMVNFLVKLLVKCLARRRSNRCHFTCSSEGSCAHHEKKINLRGTLCGALNVVFRPASSYRGTSLIQHHPSLGPYSKTVPRALKWS